MSKIYITGHKNPDLDSICAALAYAKLKNIIDPENEYIAVRCGHLNESVQESLSCFQITPPPYMKDTFPKVSDVMMKTDDRIDIDSPLSAIAIRYKVSNPSAIPVFDDGHFRGLLSIDDMAVWLLNEIEKTGELKKVPLIRDVMGSQAPAVQVTETFEDVKFKLSSSGFRGIAVFNGDEFAGYVTRRCFLKKPKYNVILVDHNEPRQSIQGIEDANVLEIIDHHRIDAVKTELPVFIDAEPLGSTCTIVAQLFKRHQVEIDHDTAVILLMGILSDTLILKSPTTTPTDVLITRSLAALLETDVETFGMRFFSNVKGLEDRIPEEAITSDFKTYEVRGCKLGIGQCEVTSLHTLPDYRDTYLSALEKIRKENGLNWTVLMVTDIMREKSVLLSTGYKAAGFLPYATKDGECFDMPGVLSRKKQLLPELISVLEVVNGEGTR